jgi:aspartate--ammonia ligase
VITENDRNLKLLYDIVRKIYGIIKETEKEVCQKFPKLPEPFLPDDIYFIHSEDLAERFPHLSPKEREDVICREKGAVFIIGIGYPLQNGSPHDGRAADYDDWVTINEEGKRGLNGDILVYYPLLDCAMELSSMGIRVNKDSLVKQLEFKNELFKKSFTFHQRLLANELPLTIGGGIGQSRLCMLLLRKAHIGEVQASIWPDEMLQLCLKHNIFIL